MSASAQIKKNRFVLLLCFLSLQHFAYAQTHAPSEIKYQKKENFYETLPIVPKGGTLYYQLSNDPKVINPVLSDDSVSSALEGYLWLPLFDLDLISLDYIPVLATDYKISRDKKNYTFTLNEKARWQDGTPVTSDDVKFTFDTIMNPKSNTAVRRSYYEGLSVKVIDKLHFTFTVQEPKFDTLFQLVLFAPIQKKQFENSKDFNKDKGILNPVGNAAYIMKKYARGQNITFERNPNWWAKDLPQFKSRFNIDKIVLRIISDQNLSYEKFLKGDIDTLGFSPEQWHTKVTGTDKNKFGTNPGSNKKNWALKVENQAPKGFSYIGWNLKNPLFKDVKTRTALSYLVNYKKIINKVFYNLAIQTTSPFGSLTLNSAPELRDPKHMIHFNPDKAMDLLTQAGWVNDGSPTLVKTINGKKVPFEFTLDTNANEPTRLKIAQIIQQDFKNSGIKVNIRTAEWNSFLDNINQRKFDAVVLGWTTTLFPNAKQIFDSNSEKNQGSNFVSYSNPKVDELIKKANAEFDPHKRNLLMQEINRLIYADQPYTFLAEGKYVLQGINSKIQSPRWVLPYSGGAESDLFYLKN